MVSELVQTFHDFTEFSNTVPSISATPSNTFNQQSLRDQSKQNLKQNCEICSYEFCTVAELNAHRQQGCEKLNEIDSIFVDCVDDDSKINVKQSTKSKRNANQQNNEQKKSVNKRKISENKKNSKRLKPANKQRVTKKQYACDKCDRVYSDRSGLSHHRHMHTGERPVKCPLCDSS